MLLVFGLLTLCFAEAPAADKPSPIKVNRTWDVLPSNTDDLARLKVAAKMMQDWTIDFAGIELNGPLLQTAVSAAEAGEPPLRAFRETLHRAVKLHELAYFLDDVLVAGQAGRRGEKLHVHVGRARRHGILVHPKEVFRGQKITYPKGKKLEVDEPAPPSAYKPAKDGDLLGPEWTARFENPTERAEMYELLWKANPTSTFTSRIAALVTQLELQKAEVYLTSFYRYPQRGYLMWGAFILAKSENATELKKNLNTLNDRNKAWKLNIDIVWEHPDGFEATKEAARRMADAYDVVYATEKGARSSNHYRGVAADFVAIDLPRTLELWAPDGAHKVFDLSDPNHTRDLSLSKELISWVETHFGLRKLTSDYPHWNDAK